MNAFRNALLSVLAALALCACVTQPVTPPHAQAQAPASSIAVPRSLQDAIAYGYSTVASARLLNASLVSGGTITVATARQVRENADLVRAGLDAAMVALEIGNADGAQKRLAAVGDALKQLETFLNKPRE